MQVWTDDPKEETRRLLLFFGSSKNVELLLSGATSSSRNKLWSGNVDTRAKQLASCIKQADEYFLAARSVTLATRPLLLFYGAHALAKAVILADNQSIELSDIRHHGLCTRVIREVDPALQNSLRTYKSDRSAWTIDDEFCIVNDGLLMKLAEASADELPNKGDVIKFSDLLSSMPDIITEYEAYCDTTSKCVMLKRQPKNTPDGKLEIGLNDAQLNVQHLLPDFTDCGNGQWISNEKLPSDYVGPFVFGLFKPRWYLVPRVKGLSSTFCLLFCGLHILSNTVRYKPAFWNEVLVGSDHGALPLIDKFCAIAEKRLVLDTLKHLWGEPVRLCRYSNWA